MKKIIYNILFTIYAIIAVFTTICLLSFNEYRITEIGKNALVIIDDNSLSPDYSKGDLVIVNKAEKDKTSVGDKVFFYSSHDRTVTVSLANVLKKEQITSTETTYTLDGNYDISSEYVIGPAKSSKIIKGVGSVLQVLESKWGFLLLIVLPSLIAFLYEIGVVISEVRGSKKSKSKE